MATNLSRMFVDPLYGLVQVSELLARLIQGPEIQRLRDVRLSNIPSLNAPGAANISRYEHSIGTAILADKLVAHLALAPKDAVEFVCAAVLHDVSITPLGHLMEEAFRYASINFNHEKRLEEIFNDSAEFGNRNTPIYLHRAAHVMRVLELKEFNSTGADIEGVFGIMKGVGVLGHFLNSDIDIDNIDNLCRMAHHIGIPFRASLPTDIIAGFIIERQQHGFKDNCLGLVLEWMELRWRLYSFLMTNPLDFSAKAMLIYAMSLALKGVGEGEGPLLTVDDWKLTDSELLRRLTHYGPTSAIVTNFLSGNIPELVGLFWIDQTKILGGQLSLTLLSSIRDILAERIGVEPSDLYPYMIKDKRQRQVVLNVRGGTKIFGEDSHLVLVGIARACELASRTRAESEFKAILSDFAPGGVTECESLELMTFAVNPVHSYQLSLFES